MADSRVQSLRKRFLETGAPEDELAWLSEARRTGGAVTRREYLRLVDLGAYEECALLLSKQVQPPMARIQAASLCSHQPAVLLAPPALIDPAELCEELYKQEDHRGALFFATSLCAQVGLGENPSLPRVIEACALWIAEPNRARLDELLVNRAHGTFPNSSEAHLNAVLFGVFLSVAEEHKGDSEGYVENLQLLVAAHLSREGARQPGLDATLILFESSGGNGSSD